MIHCVACAPILAGKHQVNEKESAIKRFAVLWPKRMICLSINTVQRLGEELSTTFKNGYQEKQLTANM